jgi:S1-C subfamily serine protease
LQVAVDIAEIAASAGPAVVGIRGGGTGVVIAAGRVLTLAGRLRGPDLEVAFRTGDTRAGTVLATDADLDVAVVDVPTGDARALAWSQEEPPSIGAAVVALGDPGGSGLRVTAGAVSARPLTLRGRRGRPVAGVIEHTAPLPRGSGGGPLLDAGGRMLGINARRHEGGLILALPAAELAPRVDALLAGRATAPRRLGVAVLSPRAARRLRGAVGLPERDGLLVRAVEPDGAAGRAGVARGDLLVALDGRPLTGVDDLYAALDAAEGSLALRVVRGADELELEVET